MRKISGYLSLFNLIVAFLCLYYGFQNNNFYSIAIGVANLLVAFSFNGFRDMKYVLVKEKKNETNVR
jgi:hypothetical protein